MASIAPLSGVLGKRRAAHLLRRTTYNPTRERINAFANKTAYQATTELVKTGAPFLAEPIDHETGQPWINSGPPPVSSSFRRQQYTIGWWANEAFHDQTIGRKMAFFLHTNFVVSMNSTSSERYFDYLALLQHYATGNFKKLAKAIVLDNAMLRYLDNTLNNKANPNENFAREYLELFTIGKGAQAGPGDYTNYTEQDVAAAARLLTGFKTGTRGNYIDPETGIPRGRAQLSQHDTGSKKFSHAFQGHTISGRNTADGMFEELDEFVEMIFDQEELAKTICRKLYRFFVSKYISRTVDIDIITPLADTFRLYNYDLGPVLKKLLRSQHFYDADDDNSNDEIIGSLIKSPLDMLHGALSFFKIELPDPLTDTYNHYHEFYYRSITNVLFPQAGFTLFYPAVVAGYPAYYQEPDLNRNWFSATTIIARYSLPEILLTGRRVLSGGSLAGVELDIVAWIKHSNNISNPYLPEIVVSELLEYMLPNFPDAERFAYFLDEVFLDNLPAADWTYEWEAYEASGDDTEVRIPLERLVTSIMYSQEYQLM